MPQQTLLNSTFTDGTLGILLAPNDVTSWVNSLVFAEIFVQPPNYTTGTTLPQEQENFLSVVLLPV